MGFPDISTFSPSHPGPYERQMGKMVANLLQLFRGRVPDRASGERVYELACNPHRWSAGHELFNEVRRQLLSTNEALKLSQYCLEEPCLQAFYNATDPHDPFDSCAPFFITVQAVGLARAIGMNDTDVIEALTRPTDNRP